MPVRVAAVQLEPKLMDSRGNIAAIVEQFRAACAQGARLVVFPEAAVTGYCFDSLEEAWPYAETIPGASSEALVKACREFSSFAIYGTLEKAGEKLFNAAVLVGPDGVIGSYRKTHLPYLGIDRFTSHSDRPFEVFEAAGLRVGMLICYDGGFPEAARCLALAGADLVVLPTNWPPGGECQAEHTPNARAHENQIYYLTCNRTGSERGFQFIGMSKICEPGGRTLAEAAHANPVTIFADVDPALARAKRIVRVPDKHIVDRFADRRPELYGPIVAAQANPSPRR